MPGTAGTGGGDGCQASIGGEGWVDEEVDRSSPPRCELRDSIDRIDRGPGDRSERARPVGKARVLLEGEPMGRPLRRHEPNTCYLVTERCHQARFLLRPDPVINAAMLEWLSRAQRVYPGILVFGVVAMSNHLHVALEDTQGELAAWASYFFGNLARAINAIRGRTGPVFSRRYSAEPILDSSALLDRLVYVVTNPVAAGLCERSRGWPGVLLWAKHETPDFHEVSWVDREACRRAGYRARRRGEKTPDSDRFRVSGVLVIHPLPAGGADWQAVASAVEAREHEIALERRQAGLSPMSRRQVLAQNWHAAPRRPKRSPRPACHTTEPSLYRSFIESFRQFVGWFREASFQWRRGKRDVTFPPWSYPPGCSLVRLLQVGSA